MKKMYGLVEYQKKIKVLDPKSGKKKSTYTDTTIVVPSDSPYRPDAYEDAKEVAKRLDGTVLGVYTFRN